MEIKKVSQQHWEMLKDLISQDLFRKKATILAAIENEKAVGVLVMEKNDIDFVISVLWTHPNYRTQHIAASLLDSAIKYAISKGATELTVSYDADRKDAHILDYLFIQKKFQIEVEKIPCYVITKDSLVNSSLFMEMRGKMKKNANIIPFGKLSTYQIKQMQDWSKEKNITMVNHINWLEVDAQRSWMLLGDGEVKGMSLLKRSKNPSAMELILFFVFPAYAAAGISLLLQTSEVLFDEDETIKSVEFICVNEKSEMLAKKMLGTPANQWISLCHATLDLERIKNRLQ